MQSKKEALLKERTQLLEKLDEIDYKIDQIEIEIILRNFPKFEKQKKITEDLIKVTKRHFLRYKEEIEKCKDDE